MSGFTDFEQDGTYDASDLNGVFDEGVANDGTIPITGQQAFNYNSGSPLTVINTTKVANLNVERVDGYDFSEYSGNLQITFAGVISAADDFILDEATLGGVPIGMRVDSVVRVSGDDGITVNIVEFGFKLSGTTPRAAVIFQGTNKTLNGTTTASYAASEREYQFEGAMLATVPVTGVYQINYTIFVLSD